MGENTIENSMHFFIEIDGLEDLEKRGKWLDAIRLLKNTIIVHKYEYKYIERYLSEMIFVLSNWDFYSIGDKNSYLNIKSEFLEEYSNFFHKEKETNDFLFLFGFFKTMFPEIFTNIIDDEEEIIKDGKKMLKKAYSNERKNELYKYFYLGSEEPTEEYFRCKKALQKKALSIFPGKTELEIYFKEMIGIK